MTMTEKSLRAIAAILAMAVLLTCIALARPAGAAEPIKVGDRVSIDYASKCRGARLPRPWFGEVVGAKPGRLAVKPDACRSSMAVFRYMATLEAPRLPVPRPPHCP